MPLMSTAEVEYYADLFEERAYGSCLTFAQFIANPEKWIDKFDGGERPLLPAQLDVQRHIDALQMLDETECAVSRLERELEHLPRRNGKPIERLKQHRYHR